MSSIVGHMLVTIAYRHFIMSSEKKLKLNVVANI